MPATIRSATPKRGTSAIGNSASVASIATASGPCTAISAVASLTSSKIGASAVELEEPFAIGVDIRGVDAQHVALVAEPINDQVVDRAAVVRAHERVLRLAVLEPRRGVGERALERRQRCGPLISNSPMWLRSKTPAELRTARCSSIIPL